jgi:rhodanese-related sulfurtransferase
MENLQDLVVTAKDNLPDVTPTPPGFHPQATAHELKSRLQWGEPGLTIIDVRDHESYNQCRIQGSMNIPVENLAKTADFSLPESRDIYVYGETEAQTSEAANILRQTGFQKVAELKGGLMAWQEIDGAVEGIIEQPGADAYNVISRLQAFREEKTKEKQLG